MNRVQHFSIFEEPKPKHLKQLLLLLTLAPCIAFGQTTAIPDSNFENALIFYGYDVAPADGSVPTANIVNIIALNVGYENIADLTGIQDFNALEQLWCGHNQLTSLDVSQNLNLDDLDCSSNDLTSLNVKNGNNSDFSNFDAASNLTLTCIDVDDAAYSNANWTNIDPQTSFSEDCSSPTGITELPTPNKQLLLITDLLGRTTQPVPKPLLFYIYDDGSVEKRIQLER